MQHPVHQRPITPARRVSLAPALMLHNAFATRYGFPGSEEHTQDIIQRDGRTFRVKATLRF